MVLVEDPVVRTRTPKRKPGPSTLSREVLTGRIAKQRKPQAAKGEVGVRRSRRLQEKNGAVGPRKSSRLQEKGRKAASSAAAAAAATRATANRA